MLVETVPISSLTTDELARLKRQANRMASSSGVIMFEGKALNASDVYAIVNQKPQQLNG